MKVYWLAPFLAAIAVFAVTIRATFVYDDVPIIQMNRSLSDLAKWGAIWTQSYNDNVDNLYRPMVTQSFAIQAWLDKLVRGPTPQPLEWPFHLVNIVLHAIVSAQVSVLARRLFAHRLGNAKARAVGLWSGLIFAVHPVHTEAVAGVVGRADLMCAIGMLGVLIVMLRVQVRRRDVMLAIVGLLVALLSKEFALLTWLIALTLAVACRMDGRSLEFSRNSGAMLALGLCLMTAGIVVLRENVLKLPFTWQGDFLDASIQPMKEFTLVQRLPVSVGILGHYAEVVAFPQWLSLDRSHAVALSNLWADPHFWAGVVVLLAGLGGFVLTWLRRQWMLMFVLLASAVTYGMVSNSVLLIATIFGERLTYIATAFLFIVMGWAVAQSGKLTRVIAAVVIVLLAVRSVSYAARWDDRAALYAYLFEQDPKNARLAVLNATNLIQDQRFMEALAYANKAIELQPDYFHGYLAAASAEHCMGNLDESIRLAEESIQRWPNHLPSIFFRNAVIEERRAKIQATTMSVPR